MRRRLVLGLAVGVALVLSACSDQPTGVEVGPPLDNPSAAIVTVGCPTTPTLANIVAQVNQLLPNTPIRASIIALINALPQRFQDRVKTVIQRLIFPIQDLIIRAFYAGKLNGGTSPGTFDKVLELIRSLYCYVGLTPPNLTGDDVAIGVFFPNTPTTTLVVPTGHAAVTVPQGAAPQGGVTVVIRKLPDTPPPLFTTLAQYPFFYEYTGSTASGPVTFTTDVTAAICLRDPIDVPDAQLRLAHNVGTAFGQVEVLPRPPVAPGVNCTDLGNESLLRSTSWRWVPRVVDPLVSVLLPGELHAATALLATTGVGGTTKKFSPFGIVDIESNPAGLDYNPGEQAFGSLAAVPGGSVTAPSVRLESQNGDPIPNWPVVFSVTAGGGTLGGQTSVTVNTGSNGVATAPTWTLGTSPGANTVSATPTTVTQSSLTLPYRPAGTFAPASLGFSATAAGNIVYESAGWRYVFSDDGVFPVPTEGFFQPSYPDIGWLTGAAGFGQDGSEDQCALILNNTATEWPVSTEILLRKPFTVGQGVTSVQVRVAIDNDIKVYVNGVNVTATAGELDPDGFLLHEQCPTRGSAVFTAQVTSGLNWLAIHGRDRGGSSYVDAEVVAGDID